MAQQDTTTPPGGMKLQFGQLVSYRSHDLFSTDPNGGRTWCRAVIINPVDQGGYVAVAYEHPRDGYQWTDIARLEDIRPGYSSNDRPIDIDSPA